jgi:hypothetical protein
METNPNTNDASADMVAEGAPADSLEATQPVPIIQTPDVAREITSAEAARVNTYRTAEQGYVREGDAVSQAELDAVAAADAAAQAPAVHNQDER